jgi:hypothetical protein
MSWDVAPRSLEMGWTHFCYTEDRSSRLPCSVDTHLPKLHTVTFQNAALLKISELSLLLSNLNAIKVQQSRTNMSLLNTSSSTHTMLWTGLPFFLVFNQQHDTQKLEL